MSLTIFSYDRDSAVDYSSLWAYGRNPKYYNYDTLGGDCTNFASQCLFAGSNIMNYTPNYGWYYVNANNKSPSWTGVPYLHNFLINNQSVGPWGIITSINKMQKGDLIQLGGNGRFYHTLFITRIAGSPGINTIFVATHTMDSYNRVLSSYFFDDIRFIHINGVRKWT